MADMKTVTINGVMVEVAQPYAAGHAINEAEAKALNQARAEAIGNNNRKAIRELLDAEGATPESVQAEVQKLISEYDEKYEFTMSTAGGSTARLDPLTKECRKLARAYIVGQIKEGGMTLKEYEEKNGENAIAEKVAEIEEHPEIVKLAKKALKDREALSAIQA